MGGYRGGLNGGLLIENLTNVRESFSLEETRNPKLIAEFTLYTIAIQQITCCTFKET